MSEMQILNLVQGSDEWIQKRLECLCASEAPVIMGDSKYQTRNQLLDLKKGWQNNPVGSFKQKMFDDGHAVEDAAREIKELEECVDYPPIVGLRIVDGMKLLASFDGLQNGVPGNRPWEHKQWNVVLSENVKNGVLTGQHFWQLEQHCIVNGCDSVEFTCSDGGEINRVSMIYYSVPERRAELLAGWKQFMIDLESHEIAAKVEQVVAKSAETFPLVKYEITGSVVTSNIKAMLPAIRERAEVEKNRTLETDQDFADKENFIKAVIKARAQLKTISSEVTGEYVSLSEFQTLVADYDEILQPLQSGGEKQVRAEKERIKNNMAESAQQQINDHVKVCDSKISPLTLHMLGVPIEVDFSIAMKNKRNIESLKSSVDDAVVSRKYIINAEMAKVVPNQIFLREHAKDYVFLFADIEQIISQPTEPFQAVVKARIADHKVKITRDSHIDQWKKSKERAMASISTEAVNIEVNFIEGFDCSEEVFGNEFDAALEIYDDCYKAIHARYRELYAEPESSKEEPAKTETHQQSEEVKTPPAKTSEPAATSEAATMGEYPRDTIYDAAKQSFMLALGIDDDAATMIVEAIDRGMIKHVSINY